MSKLENIIQKRPNGSVFLSSWLKHRGISHSLQQRYVSSKKLRKIGHGALIRFEDKENFWGAIDALQTQAQLEFHIGAHSALILLGKTVNIYFKIYDVCLIGTRSTILPKWFLNYDWGVKINYKTTDFLPKRLSIKTIPYKEFKLKVSSHIRGVLEVLYLYPNCWNLVDCFHSMELARSIDSITIQNLLKHSKSAKANRLFLLFYENVSTNEINHIGIKLGTAVYQIYKPGVYEPKYRLTLPRDLAEIDFNTSVSRIKTLNV